MARGFRDGILGKILPDIVFGSRVVGVVQYVLMRILSLGDLVGGDGVADQGIAYDEGVFPVYGKWCLHLPGE